MYRIYIADRNYQSWKLTELETNKEISPETTQQINPHENRPFNNDIISQTGQLVYSYVRECPSLAGMLILENNQMYRCGTRRVKLQSLLSIRYRGLLIQLMFRHVLAQEIQDHLG